MRYTTLPTQRLKVDGRNLRSRLFESSLQDLAQSLKQHGQLYPILVTPKGEDFAVMDGFRRVEAAKRAGIQEMLVGIIEEADADELQIAYVGNFQREGINYVDEANWLSNVLDNTELCLDELADGIGRSPAYIRSRLDILGWPEQLLQYLLHHEVSFSVAREYARLGPGAELDNALHFDHSTNPSARQASAYVAGILAARLKISGTGLGDPNQPPQNNPTELTCDACKTHPDDNQLAYGGYCFLCLAGAPRNYLDSIKRKGGD